MSEPTASTRPQLVPGRGSWIWRLGAAGGVDAVIKRARQAHLSHVFVKGGDAATKWDQLGRETVSALKSAGLTVYGWGYCYGDDPEGEAGAAAACLELDIDGWIADVEAEYKGKWHAAETYCAEITPHLKGRLFGYTPVPVIDYHLSLPYLQFNRVCDVVLPQFYWRLLGAKWTFPVLFEIWDKWSKRWHDAGEPVPQINPIGETHAMVSLEDLTGFEQICTARGIQSLSYWQLAAATNQQWEKLATIAPPGPTPPPSPPPTTPPTYDITAATEALHALWREAQAIESLEHAGHATAIRSSVIAIKDALRISP